MLDILCHYITLYMLLYYFYMLLYFFIYVIVRLYICYYYYYYCPGRRVSQSISHVCLDIPCPCVTCSIYGGLVITVLIISQDNTTIQTDR